MELSVVQIERYGSISILLHAAIQLVLVASGIETKGVREGETAMDIL